MSGEPKKHEDCSYIGGCRHLICARCNQYTNNGTQGHYWSWCSVTKDKRDFHFCCPGDCELHASGEEEAT